MKKLFFAFLLSAGISGIAFGKTVKVPENATEIHVEFTAGKDPFMVTYTSKNGQKKRIRVVLSDTKVCINSNDGTTLSMPGAGYLFKSLEVFDFVRPNAALYEENKRKQLMDAYRSDILPSAIGKHYTLTARKNISTVDFFINGNYAGSAKMGFPRNVETRGTQSVSNDSEEDAVREDARISFTAEPAYPGYLKLPVALAGIAAGKFQNAKPQIQLPADIPFDVISEKNLDIGETEKMRELYHDDYGNSGMSGRNAFDHPEASFLYTVPLNQYSYAWVLCALDPDETLHPTFTARITRYVPSGAMGGRAYSAMGDTPVDLRTADKKQVGTVRLGEKDVPVWLVCVSLNTGKIMDLITEEYVSVPGHGAFPQMRYLDFELLGETVRSRHPLGDSRTYPCGKTSGIHVYGITLERSGAELRFQQTTKTHNLFDDTMKPEMKVSWKQVVPGDYTLTWNIYNSKNEQTGTKTVKLEGASGDVLTDLSQDKLGWYRVDYLLKNGDRLLLKHEAAFALLGKDTRHAGYESPYISWCHGFAHYGGTPDPESLGKEYKMLGIHRVSGLRGNQMNRYPASAWDPYKVSDLLVIPSGTWMHEEKFKDEEDGITQIRKGLQDAPHSSMVTLYWEDHPGDPYEQAPELFDEPVPPYSKERMEKVKARTACREQCFRVMKQFPDIRIVMGNSLTNSELLAEVLRAKPDISGLNLYIGSEAIQRTAHPEKPFLPFTMMYSRQMMDVAKKLGYDLKVTCGPENISRSDYLGIHRRAEWIVRDMLVQHAFGFKDIAGADAGIGVGNSYANSFYCSGDSHAPYRYPTPSASATATLTKVLDCVEFQKFIPTGSKTVYCMEFNRAYDKKTIYVIWTSRGQAELTIKTGTPEVEMVEFHGNPSVVKTPARILKLTASTAAQYLIADAPVESAAVGKRTYEQPDVAYKSAEPLDNSARKWSVDLQEFNRLLSLGMCIRWKPAKEAVVKTVSDQEKGNCLELSIRSDRTLHNQYHEYAIIRPDKPVEIGGDRNQFGIWIKGNSGWGEIYFEMESTDGLKYFSEDQVLDLEGTNSIDFDGWCFLKVKWTKTEKPLRLTGILFLAPAHPQYITEYGECDQTIRLKDFSVLQPVSGKKE